MNKRPFLFLSNSPKWGALQIAGAYLLVGGLWILFSDQLAARIALSEQMLTVISLYKGWGYVLVTAVLLYWLIQRHTAAVHASEEQLHRLIDAMPVFISYVDANRHYQFTNRTYQEWFDDPAEGKHVEEIIGKAAYRIVSKYIDKVLSGETTSYETEFPYQDQELFMTATYIPDKAADGRVKGFFVMGQDRTAERRGAEEHRLWADAFEGCAHGIAIVDPNTNRIVVCNPAFAGLHKRRVEDLVGSAILSLYAASDHEHVRRNIEKADQIGHTRFEAYMTRMGKDGSTFPVEIDIVSVLGQDGELLHRVVTAQDITERKQAEENLRASEERYRHLFENNPHPMWTYDRQTLAFLDVNEAAIQKYGYSRSEFLGMTIRDIRPAEDVERLKENLREDRPALQQSGGWRHLLKDGNLIDVEITSHTIEINGREAALVIAQDISERKRAEEKVKESEAKYRTLVEHLPAITYISHTDEYVGVSYISPQIESLGFDRSTWVADPKLWSRSIHPEDRTLVEAELQRFQDGAEVFRAEYRLMLPNGQSRWFHDESIRVKGQDGRTILKQGFMLDITQRKQAEEELRKSQAQLSGIFNSAMDAIISIDADQHILIFNPAAETMFRCEQSEALGQPLERFLPERFREIHRKHVENYGKTGITNRAMRGSAVVFARRSNGEEFPSEASISQINVAGQKIYTVVLRDITERTQVEEVLRQSEERFASVFRSSPTPIALTRLADGKIMDVNEAFCQLFGYAREEIVGHTSLEIGIADPESLQKAVAHLQEKGTIRNLEQKARDRSGAQMDILNSVEVINVNGELYALTTLIDITERKQAEDYLRRFELLSEHSRDIILFMDRQDGRILEANTAAVQAYGYRREELLALTIRDLRAIDTRGLTAEQMAQADTGGILFETVHRRKDGAMFPVEVSSQGATVSGKRTLISIIRDITERKNAQKALTESEARFRSLFEQSADANLLLENGIFSNCNRATVQMMRAGSKEEILSLHPSELSPAYQPDGRLSTEKAEEMMRLALEKGSHRFEWIHRRMDGTDFPVEVLLTSISTGDRQVIHVVWRDITERKQIEQALQAAHDELELKVQQRTAALSEANALLQALMDNMPDHIYFKDLQSRFIRTSRSQATLLGLNDPAEAIGKTDFDFFPHAARSYGEEQEVMRSGKPLIDLEEWVVWPGGRETWVTTTKMPLRNARAETIGIFGISHDITQRKQSEEEIKQLNADLEKQAEKLQAANKELEAFSYSVSHDLRAPLRAIDGYTRILMEDYEPILDAEGKRICSIIGREARRMGQLIDDLLAFSRLGRKEMYASRIDMRGMVVAVLNELLRDEERARLDFQIGKLPEARGDSSLIRQVWFNLLANAIKFTSKKEQAVIEIGSKTNKDELIYYVRDSGAGFEMEYANKLFGVFQRLHSESEFDGTGVGLAIVQRIIHRHAGRVWAEAEVEKGATFYFALPRKENHHE